MNAKIITVIVVVFFFSACTAFGLSQGSNLQDDDLKVIQEKTFPIASGNEFILETSVGDVLITAWEKEEVYIKVLGTEKAAEKVIFDFSGDSRVVKVTAKTEKNLFSWFNKGVNLRFEVKVPAKFNNTVSTSGGDIRIADISGKNKCRTSGGDISLKRLDGNLDAVTSGGDITLESSNGTLNISTSGGDIRAMDFAGDINASTSGGDIQLKGRDSKISAETSGGDIDLIYTGTNKGIMLSSSGGDITADVPADFDADARFTTSGGNVSCNLSTNNVVKISSSKFEAELNRGGNSFVAKTSGGDITVRKK